MLSSSSSSLSSLCSTRMSTLAHTLTRRYRRSVTAECRSLGRCSSSLSASSPPPPLRNQEEEGQQQQQQQQPSSSSSSSSSSLPFAPLPFANALVPGSPAVIGDGTRSQSSGSAPGPLDAVSIGELTALAYFELPVVGLGVHRFASGTFAARVGEDEFLIDLADVRLSPVIEVSARVHVAVGGGGGGGGGGAAAATAAARIAGGIVAKVSGDGNYAVLLDSNTYLPCVPASQIVLAESRPQPEANAEFAAMLEWVQDAGVRRRSDRERICATLYMRGWRESRLYLLEPADVHCMVHVRRSVRLTVLNKAEWQRMHHDEMRALLRERVKEREWRYFVQKFSGFFSANWAGLGVLSVFLWNFKNYRKQQRAYQMKFAVGALTNPTSQKTLGSRGGFVERSEEEAWARKILRRLDITRPRIAVLTGMAGSGKSSLFRTAVRTENKPALFVEVRGREDALACVLKAMKVPSPDACGDYIDFISDAFRRATAINGEPPIVVVTLREGSELQRTYHETAVLACDRMLCHLVFEVALESLTPQNISLPRLDFYTVPDFTPRQAMAYTQHRLDPISMQQFIETVGTNSNDVDELFAIVKQRGISIPEYTNNKLAKAMRQVHAAWSVSIDHNHHSHDHHHHHHHDHDGVAESHAPRARTRHHNHHNSVNSSTTHTTSGGGSASAEDNEHIKGALRKLAEADYSAGQHSGVDVAILRHPALAEIVLYDPVQDRWVFKHKILHSAVRCSL